MPYAAIIEYGARGENIKIGRKMIEALAAWAKRHGMVGPEPGDDTRVAWGIATNLAKRGIFNEGKGLRILEKSLKKLQPILDEEYAREIKRET
jgi:hypothetical protein